MDEPEYLTRSCMNCNTRLRLREYTEHFRYMTRYIKEYYCPYCVTRPIIQPPPIGRGEAHTNPLYHTEE